MTTYEVPCQYCGRAQLFERAEPLDDPGTLPAFCSTDCSRNMMLAQWSEFIESEQALLVHVSCGCMVLMFGLSGGKPWLLCGRPRDQTKPLEAAPFELYRRHSAETHQAAQAIVADVLADPECVSPETCPHCDTKPGTPYLVPHALSCPGCGRAYVCRP